MSYIPISKLSLVDEQEAAGEIAELFDDIRQTLGIPSPGVVYRIAGLSSAVLTSSWGLYRSFTQRTSLPLPLLFMIHYSISSARKCKYCSAGFKVVCRSVGVDEEMLDALVNDMNTIAPRRTQEIIKFAVKCALDPQSLTEEDYDRVREQGLSEEELVEVIGWVGIAMYHDTISDALKLEEPEFQQILEI
jgi:alkylhydroperoxidase family enzyme